MESEEDLEAQGMSETASTALATEEVDFDFDPDDPINGMDDCLSALTAEHYFNSRTLKLRQYYEQQVPGLSWSQNSGDLLLFACSFAASLLGAFHMSIWIPVVLGYTAFLTALIGFHGVRAKLIALNQAIAGLQAIEMEWCGRSNVDRRTPRFKAYLVSATEQLSLNVQLAAAGLGATVMSSEGVEEDGKEEDKAGSQEKKKS